MVIKVRISDRVPIGLKSKEVQRFFQSMMDRLAVGHYRYGDAADKTRTNRNWVKRIKAVAERYENSGNAEFMIDAANYALLEYLFPEHPAVHFKVLDQGSAAESVTQYWFSKYKKGE